MSWRRCAVAMVTIGSLLAGCDGGSDSAEPDQREQFCSIAVDGLAEGLKQYMRTEAVGDLLAAASDAVAVPCRNAIANLQAGRPITFELLRPNASPVTLSVDLEALTSAPPPIPPPGSSPELQQRWSSCWSGYSDSNWMLDLCLQGVIDPLTSGG